MCAKQKKKPIKSLKHVYPHSKNILSLNIGSPSNSAPHLYKYNTYPVLPNSL